MQSCVPRYGVLSAAPLTRSPMPLSQRSTLTQFLIEERRRFPEASGDFNALILDVSLACKAIARRVSFGELDGGLGDQCIEAGAPAGSADRRRCGRP